MILDTLENAARVVGLKEGFAEAFGFLSQPNLEQLELGKHEIAGDRIFAIVDRTEGREISEGQLEGHRKYIDIQYVISGEESMGWSPKDGLSVAIPYDKERDLEFFEGSPASTVLVPPGTFAIFFPSDAHLPQIGKGSIHKIVVKIALRDN